MALMYHPDFPDREPTPTSIQAFNLVWRGKGWLLVTDKPTSPGSPIAVFADLTLSELRDKASEMDIPGRSSMNRDELISALIEATSQPSEPPNNET
jgi:hypothetical protein